MAGSHGIAPAHQTGARPVRGLDRRLAPPAVAIVASGAAAVILATRATDETLDYGVGIVPAPVPWLAAGLAVAIAVAALATRGRPTSLAGGPLLAGALIILTAWSIAMLPFDALRMVGLVPLPLSVWGLVLRSLLLVAAAGALVTPLRAQRASRSRCPACRRPLPGRLDMMPRWPAALAIAAAMVYPVLRTIWAVGGTFGTAAGALDLDPAVAWGVVVVGIVLVAFSVVLFIGKGPTWARALLGLGGLVAGTALAVLGGLGAIAATGDIAAQGIGSSQGGHLMTWVFVLVYASWFVAGLGVTAGSWRYWARRREDCPSCSVLLGA